MTAEDRLQEACVKWFNLQYPNLLLASFPNGGYRHAATGKVLKRTGARAGAPDLILFRGVFPYHGLLIEMKVGKNRLTPAQKTFREKTENEYYKYVVCYSFEEFKHEIETYLFT